MTIRDLAKILGLSTATVSYALRNASRVNAQTREMVRRRALELGYQPNPVASAFLRQIRAGQAGAKANLAFLIPKDAEWVLDKMTDLPEGARERARELGYGMDVVRMGDYSPARLTKLLLARGVMGVMLSPLHYETKRHVSIDWSKFAAVAYGYSITQPRLHRVVHNHLNGMQTALGNLKAKGHRRVGLLLADEVDMRSGNAWSSGFAGFQKRLPEAECVKPLFGPGNELTAETIRRWLGREKPDAVIFHTTGSVSHIPEFKEGEIPCVALNHGRGDPVAGIDQEFKRCGRLLVDVVSAQIMHNERGTPETPIISMVNGTWIDHASLGQSDSSPKKRPSLPKRTASR